MAIAFSYHKFIAVSLIKLHGGKMENSFTYELCIEWVEKNNKFFDYSDMGYRWALIQSYFRGGPRTMFMQSK